MKLIAGESTRAINVAQTVLIKSVRCYPLISNYLSSIGLYFGRLLAILLSNGLFIHRTI